MSPIGEYKACPRKALSSETLNELCDRDLEDDALLHRRPQNLRQRSLRTWWLFCIVSHVLVAGLTSTLTRLSFACPRSTDEYVPLWMSNIDRSFHIEVGNAAETISSDPNDPDAGNQSWNNFTVSAEIGGADIEDWWLDLGAFTTPVLVPERYAKDFNFDPNTHAMVSPDDAEYPPGAVPYKGYPASIEVMHKLHCLNMLRQANYYNHHYYRSVHSKPWALPEHDLVRHIGHCVDILRQKIICEAEIELVPFLNDKIYHRRNDWARPKKCRNFEAVRSWLHEHQWKAGDPDFYLDDEHPKIPEVVTKMPKHTKEELWRGF